MKLYTIWKQLPERYDGEYAPDCEEVITEYAHDEVPSWLNEKIEEAKQQVADGDYAAYRVIEIEVDDADIDRAFGTVVAKGTIVDG